MLSVQISNLTSPALESSWRSNIISFGFLFLKGAARKVNWRIKCAIAYTHTHTKKIDICISWLYFLIHNMHLVVCVNSLWSFSRTYVSVLLAPCGQSSYLQLSLWLMNLQYIVCTATISTIMTKPMRKFLMLIYNSLEISCKWICLPSTVIDISITVFILPPLLLCHQLLIMNFIMISDRVELLNHVHSPLADAELRPGRLLSVQLCSAQTAFEKPTVSTSKM